MSAPAAMRSKVGRGFVRRVRSVVVAVCGALSALAGTPAAAVDSAPIIPRYDQPTAIYTPQPLAPPVAPVGLPAVGILLPLSGRYQSFGESCLRGIRIALGNIGDREPALRMVVLDTQGDSAQTASSFRKLATDPGVVAVLGPMISADVDAVLPYAQSFELPTFSFSPRPIPVGGPVFRFSLTKEDQAAVLARYAVGELGLRRWAMLHPDDSYGREISSHFRLAAERLGGRIIADVDYPPDKADLQAEARRLQAKVGAKPDQTPAVDGIFIPDAAGRLGMLTSYLEFVDIRGVQLLGGSGWDRPRELLAAMPTVNGGVFVDGFFLHSFRPEVRTFVDLYRDAHGGDPGALEAYGYDAASIVRTLVAGGASTRQALLAELRRPHLHRGATGETVIGAGGRLDKGLFLLKVEDGTILEIDSPAAAPLTHGLGEAPPPASGWRRPEFDSRSMDDRIGH